MSALTICLPTCRGPALKQLGQLRPVVAGWATEYEVLAFPNPAWARWGDTLQETINYFDELVEEAEQLPESFPGVDALHDSEPVHVEPVAFRLTELGVCND